MSDVLEINHVSDTPKYLQIVNSVNDAVANNVIKVGDALPSVNYICKTYNVSRDTVFKAYSLLKENNIIESVPNKGYYVAGKTKKVLLVLDTFKAYKEVLYHSFIKNLPEDIIADVQFHHYNIENFKTILNNSQGKYYKYIVMNFNHKDVSKTIDKIEKEKLLIIDWNIYSKPQNNYVVQDFGKAFYNSLTEATTLFKKYKLVNFVYPEFTNHPYEAVSFFKKYCEDFGLEYKIVTNSTDFKIQKNIAYISVSDRVLGSFLEQSRELNYEPGVDVGFLSYNETPMKKFIYKGISVVSTNFKELGKKAAEFVAHEQPIQYVVSTKLIVRESL